jgi:GAF domain-containing protein
VSGEELRAAVAAAALGSEDLRRSLLGSIVEVARAILGARASSIVLLDEAAGELVFEAVAGEGESLLGTRIPAARGIAGWVAQSGEALAIEDVSADPRFARDVAEQTGYVPKGLIAVPLIAQDRVIGVLSVLDRPEQAAFSVAESDLLSLFATQAAAALALVTRTRRAQRVLEGEDEPLGAVARLATTLDRRAGEENGQTAVALLEAIERVLRDR